MPKNIRRRNFIKALGFGAAALSFPYNLFSSSFKSGRNNELLFYAGSYASSENKGIYLLGLNAYTGQIRLINSFGGIENPSYLAISNSNKFLYAVSETDKFEGGRGGGIFSFKINESSFELELINSMPTGGEHPCHASINGKDKFLFVANYTGGNISVFQLLNNGGVGERVDIKNFSGFSINKFRQEAPHAHSVNLSPTEKYLLASDLGTDKIMIYNFDASTGKLNPTANQFIKTGPGAGPRHLAFEPGGMFLYSLNELNSTVSVYAFFENDGSFEHLQNISTLPEGFKNENTCAEITVSGDGRFVYASNRGHNTIAVFAIDKSNGKLSLVQHQSTTGKTPRNFEIDPTGKFLLAANQDSNNIVVFKIDAKNGRLFETDNGIELTKPVCIKFLHKTNFSTI